MSETVLITGGAGFIGSHLADGALAAGHRVVVIDDLSTGHRRNVPAAARLVEANLRHVDDLAALLRDEGVTVVNHHAAQANVRVSLADPVHDANENVIASLRLVQACRECGVRRFLFASSGGTVYGEQREHPCDESHPVRPESPYGCAKLAVEHYLRAFWTTGELEPVIFRYANVYGARQDPKGECGIVAILAEKLLAGERPTIFGDGDQTRDYVHVADVAAASRRAMTDWVPGVYNVGTGTETSVNDLYQRVAAALDVDIEPEYGPPRAGELRRSSLSSAKLRTTFDLPPMTGLDEGLRLTFPYYRAKIDAA